MKKTAVFSDTIFIFAVLSLPTLCLMRYLRYSLFVSAVVAVLLALSVCALFLAFVHKRSGELTLKKRDEEEKDKLMFALAMMGKKPLADLTLSVFEKQDERACLKKYGSIYAVSYQQFVCFPVFSFEDVGVEEIEKICRIKTAKRKQILCNGLSDRAKILAERLALSVVAGVGVYALFQKNGVSPLPVFQQEPNVKKSKTKFKKALLRKNAKRFFLSGGLLLIASLFAPFSYYYLLFGGLLTLAAFLLRVFGLEESQI